MTRLVATRGQRGAVICAQPSCRRELPGIGRMEGEYIWPDEEAHEPYLFMAEGWHLGHDGIWRMTPRGLRRRAFLSGRVQDVRRHAHAALTVEDLDDLGGPKGRIARVLPSVVICPFCGTPQRLDPDVLGVAPRANSHATYTQTDRLQD